MPQPIATLMAPTSVARALAIVLALVAWASATALRAESRALLIGVGQYAALPRDYSLAAPARDIARIGSALRAAGLGEAAITTLSDEAGPRGATRSDILEALDRLTFSAQAGDKVLIYFSGHGGRRPSRADAGEGDGLEEVWLASDATVDAAGQPDQGAIADHEAAAAIARLRRRGVDVWLVVDACYGAGVTRGRPAIEGMVKTVSRTQGAGATFDGPLTASRSPKTGMVADARLGTSDESGTFGAFAGFYAAAQDGLAIATDQGSVFSNALARSLDAGRTRSLRDLAAGLLSADGRLGPDAPRPVFEGDLDGPVLNLAPGRQRRFGVTRRGTEVTVAAGAEEGLIDGDRVVLENAASAAVGYAEVTQVRIGRALLSPGSPDAVSARLTSADRGRAETSAARVLAAIAALDGGWAPDSLAVAAWLDRRPAMACDAPVDAEAPPVSAIPVSLFALPEMQACDRLYLDVANAGPSALDVNLLYLAADGGVVAPSLHPVDSVRLAPGEHRTAALRFTTEPARVTEHLAVLATPATTRFPADLRYLSHPSRAVRGGLGGATSDALSTWLVEALDADIRRGAASGPPPGQASVAAAFPVVVGP